MTKDEKRILDRIPKRINSWLRSSAAQLSKLPLTSGEKDDRLAVLKKHADLLLVEVNKLDTIGEKIEYLGKKKKLVKKTILGITTGHKLEDI